MTMTSIDIIIGADHGGVELSLLIERWLRAEKTQGKLEEGGMSEVGGERRRMGEILRFGSKTVTDRLDYPDVAKEVCLEVLRRKKAKEGSERGVVGLVFCGTGIGISIGANKIGGIRCALVHDHYGAKMAREHNDANVLALGGRTTGEEVAKECVETFLVTSFLGLHHTLKVEKLGDLDQEREKR